MDKVKRFDVINLDAKGAVRLDNGMLRAPVTLSRVGVFSYRNPDGSTRRELRLPEEVFATDSMASFELVPFVDEHPYSDQGEVTAENSKRLQVGSVGGVHRAQTNLDATVMVTDESIVAKVLLGKEAVSCGYFCDREFKPGIYTDAEGGQHPYDCIQRNIRGNHVALVAAGRAGPEARIRLDATDAVLVADETPSPEAKPKMEKLILDSLPAEMPAASAAIVNKAIAERDAKIAKLTADAAGIRSEADKASAERDAAKAELSKANDPAKFAGAVAARVALESKARGILGAEFAMDGKDARVIKAACVAKLSPALTCDGKSDEYTNALFDVLSETVKTNPATEAVRAQVRNAPAAAVTDSASEDYDPRAAFERSFFNPSAK